jgi:hypothetical protein
MEALQKKRWDYVSVKIPKLWPTPDDSNSSIDPFTNSYTCIPKPRVLTESTAVSWSD